jgi:hypothetical protein
MQEILGKGKDLQVDVEITLERTLKNSTEKHCLKSFKIMKR